MHAPVPLPLPASRRSEVASLAALCGLAISVLAWRWVGFQGHDDAYYASAALDWLYRFPALGNSHWALRYPLILPMAVALGLFGKGLAVLAVPTLVAYLAWLAFTYLCVRAWFGWPTAALCVLAGILVPEFPVQATYANPDMLELVFAMAAFWCHQAALRRPDRVFALLHCGAFAALAFLTRETSAALILYFGVLMVVRPGMRRRAYLWIALAFAVLVGLEFAYLFARTGDFLFRLHLSATHDQVDRAAQGVAAASAGHALDSEGVLAGGPVWQVFAVLCVSQKYGFLFPLLPAALWYGLRHDRLSPGQRRAVVDAAILAAAFVLFIAFAGGALYIVPRYFTAAAGAAIIPVAAAAACLVQRSRRVGGVAAGVFALSCLPLLAAENTDPLFAVRRLVALAASSPDIVHTDPYTAAQAAIPLWFAGLAGRASAAPPGPGALVAIPEGVATTCRATRTCGFKDQMAAFEPRPDWALLARQAPSPRLLGRLARAVGLAAWLPNDIMRKLEQPNAALMIYRVGKG